MIVVGQADEQVRAIVTATLKSLDCEVAQVCDGNALLECFSQHGSRISLFVLEKELPGRSAFDCLTEIRRDGLATPAVVFTDSGGAGLPAQLDGITRLLPMPFRMAQLERIASDLLSDEGRTLDPT